MSQYDAGGSAPRVNTPRPNPPRKKPSGDADWGSWLLIAIMFATGLWPIGLFLLVKKLSDGRRKPKTSGSSAPRQTPAAPAQTNSMRSSSPARRSIPPRAAGRCAPSASCWPRSACWAS